MANRLFLRAYIFSILFVMFGCSDKTGNTTTGNPLVGMALTGSASNATVSNKIKNPILNLLIDRAFAFPPPNSLFDANGNSVSLQKYWINIGNIEFKSSEIAEGGEVDGSDIDFTGPYAVDMLTSSPQTLGMGVVGVINIHRIKVKLVTTSSVPNSAPAGLSGKSIYIAGQVNGNTFIYTTSDESEIQVSGPSAINAVTNKNFLLELQTANLIKKISLSMVTGVTNINESNRVTANNPCPAIDSSAADLYTCFRKGLETEAKLGRDDDGNFHLDSNEESVN